MAQTQYPEWSGEGGEARAAALPEGRGEAWYAIWTHSHCERLVAGQLEAKGFNGFLPEMPVRKPRRAASGALAPMFPGYLFVHDALDKERYIEILKVRGVVRILEDGWTRLTSIPNEEIEAVRRVLASDALVSEHPFLQSGDRVRVTDGPLSGLEGLFVRDQHKGRLVVSVGLLGRSVAVEMDAASVEPARAA